MEWQGLRERKQRTVPRCLVPHPRPGGSAPSHCGRGPDSAATRLHPFRPRRAGTHMQNFSASCFPTRVSATGAVLGPQPARTWAQEQTSYRMNPGPLLSFGCITFGLGKSRLFSNHLASFLAPPRLVQGPRPVPSCL